MIMRLKGRCPASAAYSVAISLSPGATTAATGHQEKAQLQ